VHGVQFHPESIASEHGRLILKNFLEIAADWNAASHRPPQAN
jgi:anthranilate synthase component II